MSHEDDEDRDVEFLVEEAVQEELEDRVSKTNSVNVSSHDITVRLNSETTDMEELVRMANETMEKREKAALRGEYEVLEEEDLLSQIFGPGDR